MISILQLSDFHIRATMPEPQNNIKIVKFIKFIKELNVKRPILVYNGDVIDSRIIEKKIPDDVAEDKKAQIWEEEAKKAYDLAERYFKYIMEELEISNDRIIICCGNHDINLYSGNGESFHCPVDDIRKVEYGSKRFTLINAFTNNLVLRKGTYITHLRKIDGINFLVANSQWTDKGSNKLCIHCDSINDVINEHQNMLSETMVHFSKQHNIFVAHSPREDYCEYALHAYQENKYEAVASTIDTYFGLELFGDKHSDSKHNFDYIVGAPLDEERITYGLHQFNDKHQYFHRALIYNNEQWETNRSSENIEEILTLSIGSLKGRALKYLFDSDSKNGIAQKILNFDKTRSEDGWKQFDKLFRSYISLQKSMQGKAGDPISVTDGMINTVSDLIISSEKQISLVLRGRARIGKSIFMTVLYLNLLYRFYCGPFPYLPVYINVEEIEKEISEKTKGERKKKSRYQTTVASKVKSILDKAIDYSQIYDCQICCLFDGLKQQVLSKGEVLEEKIKSIIDNLPQMRFRHYIYCIDTDNDLNFTHTSFATGRDAQYLAYFDSITIMNVNSTQKYEDFISAFLALNKDNERSVQILKANIDKMQIQEIDLNTLCEIGEDLIRENGESFFNILDNYAERKLKGYDIEKAAVISYRLYCLKQNYSIIKEKELLNSQVAYNLFEIIRTQKLISRYLIAVYYVKTMINPKNSGNFLDDSPLNQLYDHEICSYIRGYILKKHCQRDVQEFAQNSYKKLNYAGKSTLTYIVGRLGLDSSRLKGILREEKNKLGKKPNAKHSEREVYEFYVAKRSIYVSEAANLADSDRSDEDYLYILLSNGFERKINRDFYLQFYGDRSVNQIKLNEEVILYGFDIYKTYHILASRLKGWAASHDNYPLLRIELFTLCDLIQIRMDHQFITARVEEKTIKMVQPGTKIYSFFYNSKYNLPKKETAFNVLKTLIFIIDEYMKINPDQTGKDIFIQYLNQARNNCTKLFEMISNPSKHLGEPGFQPERLFTDLSRLEMTKKIGWNIPQKINKLNADEYKRIAEDDIWYENTLEHVYECYLIGLLYLPAISYQSEKYKKQDILNMIWIHDLGEAYIGDYPPFYDEYEKTRIEENERCQYIFLSGMHNQIADMTEYLKIWNEWNDPYTENINIRIAKEIDKIQMIYKLFVLITQEEVDFSSQRVKDFCDSINKIRTVEGRQIFNTIIASNDKFVEAAANYGVSIAFFM